jgi:hypothetical protein
MSVKFDFHYQRKTPPEKDKDGMKLKGKTYPPKRRDEKEAHSPSCTTSRRASEGKEKPSEQRPDSVRTASEKRPKSVRTAQQTDLDFLEGHPVPHDVDLLCWDVVGDVPNLAVSATSGFHYQRETPPEEDKDKTKREDLSAKTRDEKEGHSPATDLDFLEGHPTSLYRLNMISTTSEEHQQRKTKMK